MVILEEVNLLLPWYHQYNMVVMWKALNCRNTTTTQCAKGEERKRRRLAAEQMRKRAERAFRAYGIPLDMSQYFKYLGRILTASDDNWLAVVGNLRNSHKSWARL